ncbi:alginate export family protein [Pedobacter sp. FW305-3-2-15-E-R2A2]|uniref:alginate export family protein n=1 Tax=Pedobacter sp. FW305-3-2-15-E-R2A2 TaxID=3140251 RepID=UPI00314091CC
MKKIFLISLLLVVQGAYVQAQGFKAMRFDEDYSTLVQDTTKDWYQKLKFMPISKSGNTYLSIGGEFRNQYFKYEHPDWGEAPKDADGFVLGRYLIHSDLHVGKSFRLFGQIQSSSSSGEAEEPSPVNQNPLEIHQLFADGVLPLGNQASLLFRIGRQELSFGSQRIVSVREAPNNRQAFDGIKLQFRDHNMKLDALYTHYVQAKSGIFDDRISSNIKLWGLYSTINEVPLLKQIDLYYLGYERRRAVFDDISGKERRNSIGLRTWKSGSTLEYDIEALYQFGKISGDEIRSWTLSANLGYHFKNVLWKPKVGVKSEFIAGDKSYDDGRLNTFNPLFPKGGYFGMAALIGPANLFDVHPYVEFSLTKNLLLSTDYDFFWRMEKSDGIYAVNGKLIYSGKNTKERFIGGQLGTALEYNPVKYLYFRAEFSWFDTGKFLKEAGPGRDIQMYGLTATIKF